MSKKRLVIVTLTLFAIIGLVFWVLYFYSIWDKPLGPSLQGVSSGQSLTGSDQPTTSTGQPVPSPEQLQTPVFLFTPAQFSTQEQANQPQPLCGDVPVLTVLAIGIDFRGEGYLYGLADVIKIARIDFTTHKVSVLTLDRGIWVEIPGISDHYGITHGMLNQSYFFGVPAMGYYDGPGGGAGLLAQTLKRNFDLNVDNYVVVDFTAFVKFVDAIGGIDVYLPEPVDGNVPPDGSTTRGEGNYYSAGTHHLSGMQALNLARIRYGYSTLDRDRNQDTIIKAIYAKITSPEIILRIPKILEAFKNAGLTDLSPRQIEDLVCLVQKMNSTDLSMKAIPDEYYVYDWIYSEYMKQDVNIWNIDFNIFRYYIDAFRKDQWPQE